MPAVGLMAVAIDSGALFGGEFVGVAMQKPSNLALRNLLLRHCTAIVLEHLSC